MSKQTQTKAILIDLSLPTKTKKPLTTQQELRFLAEVADYEVVLEFEIKLRQINPATLIGSGKLRELSAFIAELAPTHLIFSEPLSSIQLRNLSRQLKLAILDRNELILKIFAKRAQSKLGQLQVRLASLQYELPRLIGNNDFSGLVGGQKTRGLGEQKLELQRRDLQKEITKVTKQIKKQQQIYQTTRKKRQQQTLPQVTLVGYTNAGKSTILNQLLNTSDQSKLVYTADNIFASLDTSSRLVYLKNDYQCIVNDSVGFISDLPKELLTAFYATLLEIETADLIVHVLDSASPDLLAQLTATKTILKQLKLENTPIIYVFNKADLNGTLLVEPYVAEKYQLKISAFDQQAILELKALILQVLKENNHYR